MTRADLINQLMSRCPDLTRQEAGTVVTSFCQQITTAVARGEQVTLRGFGRFTQRVLPPRRGRNPRTGEPLTLPTHKSLKFKAARVLKTAVNQPPQPPLRKEG